MRSSLVAEMRARLDRETFPRVIVLVLLLVAGGVALVTSVTALAAGVDSMASRYALATLAGYLAFIGLIRIWIVVRRGWRVDADLDVGDFNLRGHADTPASDVTFSGGQSGGGGGSAGWDEGRLERGEVPGPEKSNEALAWPPEKAAERSGDGFGAALNLDDALWLALASGAVLAGVLALGFIVYSAPLLLAEVALDAALVSTVYRRLRREDARYWATTTVRRTWAPVLVMLASMTMLGFVLQLLAPGTRSIGGVVAHLLAGA